MPARGTHKKVQTKRITSLEVLIYDDDARFRQLLSDMMGQSREITFSIQEAEDTEQMELSLKNHTPDVIVLDLELRGKSGLEWLRDIKKHEIAPVVIITGSGDERQAVEAMKSGAYDYIPKAYLTFDQLTKSLINAHEKWNLLKERQVLLDKLAHMAMYDGLTDVLSRRALLEQMEFETQRTKRYNRNLAILMIDIDRFKKVNDTYGHIVGDVVLKRIAQTLKEQTRRSDFVGRYGGEEFLVILPETSLGKAVFLAEKLREQVANLAIKANGTILKGTSISIGAAAFDNDASVDEFINRSDKWLYKAKEAGRNQVQPKVGTKN
ncbi:MAG: GGDEF domain-containing response regulator [Fidelibacterota bacterium]|nr:MAG: GGDEF domain-containing response regulator [Candidatus Neomarinimicrobiota bacterium]